ncbi:MAG: membrane-bound PQQ-dependent dehydrogenase, glucose/quinate/shikimate family, partial [Stenotrophomonas sp.]
MSAATPSDPTVGVPARHPLILVLSLVLIVLGVVVGGLGAWLAQLGGSWYYVLAGAGLLLSGVLLFGNRRSGAAVYLLVFVGTLLWTWWESGSDYWRWVPRLGMVSALGFVLALLLPTLRTPVPRRVSRALASVLGLVFAVGFALAFVPHGAVAGTQPFPVDVAGTGLAPTRDASPQPSDQPAPGDWAAWGRSNAATRYSPLQQITPANVGELQLAWQFRTGDLPKKRWGAETTPLKVGDTLYLCT